MKARGSILVGLLWCLALLSIVVVGALHSARLDLMVVKNHGDLMQAHYLALAGIERAKALLYQDAVTRRKSHKNYSGELANAPEYFKDIRLGRGEYRVFHQGDREDSERILFGVTDEESRLNVNYASIQELGKLYEMPPEVAAEIADYRDEDETVSPNGAEAGDYAALRPPYLPRNAPFQTTRELLMVLKLPRELLVGEDANQNGMLDPEEDDGDESFPPDNRDGYLDAGWSGVITVDSSVQNVNAAGEDRVNVKSADENALLKVQGITAPIARAIVSYRGQNQLDSLADLLDVTAAPPQSQAGPQSQAPPVQSQQQTPPVQGQPQAQPNAPGQGRGPVQQNVTVNQNPAQPAPGRPAGPPGPKMIDENLLMEIADDITVGDDKEQAGAVNINTASLPVLICLPGINEQLAQALITYRRANGFFSNIAGLLKVPGMTREIFKQLAGRITARSETFRILSEGKVSSSGARKRIQAIVHVTSSRIDTLSYREDL